MCLTPWITSLLHELYSLTKRLICFISRLMLWWVRVSLFNTCSQSFSRVLEVYCSLHEIVFWIRSWCERCSTERMELSYLTNLWVLYHDFHIAYSVRTIFSVGLRRELWQNSFCFKINELRMPRWKFKWFISSTVISGWDNLESS